MTGILRAGPSLLLPGQVSPGGVPSIDWNHPLARGLISYWFDPGTGRPVDLVLNRMAVLDTSATIPAVTATPYGQSAAYVVNQSSLHDPALFPVQSWAAPYSAAVGWWRTTTSSVGSSGGVFGLADGIGNNALLFFTPNTTTFGVSLANQASAFSFTPVASTFYVAVVAATGASASSNWVNGIAQTAGTTTTTFSGSNEGITFGSASYNAVQNTNPRANVFFGAIWNRALNAGEALQLYTDPYCLLQWGLELPPFLLPITTTFQPSAFQGVNPSGSTSAFQILDAAAAAGVSPTLGLFDQVRTLVGWSTKVGDWWAGATGFAPNASVQLQPPFEPLRKLRDTNETWLLEANIVSVGPVTYLPQAFDLFKGDRLLPNKNIEPWLNEQTFTSAGPVTYLPQAFDTFARNRLIPNIESWTQQRFTFTFTDTYLPQAFDVFKGDRLLPNKNIEPWLNEQTFTSAAPLTQLPFQFTDYVARLRQPSEWSWLLPEFTPAPVIVPPSFLDYLARLRQPSEFLNFPAFTQAAVVSNATGFVPPEFVEFIARLKQPSEWIQPVPGAFTSTAPLTQLPFPFVDFIARLRQPSEWTFLLPEFTPAPIIVPPGFVDFVAKLRQPSEWSFLLPEFTPAPITAPPEFLDYIAKLRQPSEFFNYPSRFFPPVTVPPSFLDYVAKLRQPSEYLSFPVGTQQSISTNATFPFDGTSRPVFGMRAAIPIWDQTILGVLSTTPAAKVQEWLIRARRRGRR